MAVELWPSQQAGSDWLLEHYFGIIGDEAGLGKTYTAIDAASQVDGDKLITVPKYLMGQWYDSLLEFGVDPLDIALVQGSPAHKRELLSHPFEWTIISYNMLGQTHEKNRTAYNYSELLKRRFARHISDEAHRYRNRDAQWTKQAHRIRTDGRWLLTGSPVYRNAGDVWSLLNLCDPKRFRSYWSFVNEYCLTEQTMYKEEVVGVKNPKVFRSLLNEYMLRRRFKDIAHHLPQLMPPITIRPPLSAGTRSEYHALEATGFDEKGAVSITEQQAITTQLRQLTGSDPNKVQAVSDLVEDINDRVIILTWFHQSAWAVADKLKCGPPVTGAMSPDKRVAVLNQAAANPRAVVVATMESIKEGLNLQHFTKVVFYEEDWQAETNNQMLARFQRAGQTKRVQQYLIRSANTIDEAVHGVQKNRNFYNKQAMME